MAKIKGKDGTFSLGGNTHGEIEEYNIETSITEEEGVTLGEDWSDPEGLIKKWNGSATLFYDPDDAQAGDYEAGSEFAAVFYPNGNTTGEPSRSGNLLITAVSQNVAVGSLQKISVTFVGKGALTEGTVA